MVGEFTKMKQALHLRSNESVTYFSSFSKPSTYFVVVAWMYLSGDETLIWVGTVKAEEAFIVH